MQQVEEFAKGVQSVIAENCVAVETAEEFSLEQKLSDVILSSIEFIKVVVALEDKYNIKFSAEELEPDNFQLIKDMVEFVQSKTN